MSFRDREEAGRRLAEALYGYRDVTPIVLALPRGGVPVAAKVAERLDAPLDLLIVRKIGVPGQPELAMGAVVEGPPPFVLKNDAVIAVAGVSRAEFAAGRERELQEARRRRSRYLADTTPPNLAGQVVIVVDDGVATGATMRVALKAIRAMKPRQIIVAVPVAPTDTLAILKREADEVICLESHSDFGAIGSYYANFNQVSDEQVIDTLQRFRRSAPADSSRRPPSAS